MATTHTPINLSSQEYFDNALTALKKEFSSLNPFSLPKIKKICINTGIGKLFDTKQKQQIVEYLNKMTGSCWCGRNLAWQKNGRFPFQLGLHFYSPYS